MIDYFTLYNFEKSFDITPDQLEDKYLSLQSEFHPDKSTSEEEKIRNIKISADINSGYKTLKSSISRAEHLLELENIRVNKEQNNSYETPQEILLEQLELREKVFDSNKEKLKPLEKEIKSALKLSKQDFSELYKIKHWKEASEKAIKMRYLDKLLEEIKKLKRTL